MDAPTMHQENPGWRELGEPSELHKQILEALASQPAGPAMTQE
jgi:hypothetical protein